MPGCISGGQAYALKCLDELTSKFAKVITTLVKATGRLFRAVTVESRPKLRDAETVPVLTHSNRWI